MGWSPAHPGWSPLFPGWSPEQPGWSPLDLGTLALWLLRCARRVGRFFVWIDPYFRTSPKFECWRDDDAWCSDVFATRAASCTAGIAHNTPELVLRARWCEECARDA